jgi:hypothetical protein
MRYLLSLVILFSGMTFASGDPSGDSAETRHLAAERYLQVADLGKLLGDVTDQMARTIPEDKRDQFKVLMKKHVRVDVLRDAMMASMVKNFTTRELNALANFYGSPEGRSAMAKIGSYMADLMPAIQAEMRHAVEESRAAGEFK